MGQWLIVDTLLRRAGACGSRPTQAGREAGTPCGRVGRIAPSKLLNLRAGLGIRRIGNQGRGAEGQEGREGALGGGIMEGKWKVQGARLSGMWNVECSVEGRRCWWKEKVGEQDTSRCTTLTTSPPSSTSSCSRPHPPRPHSTVQIQYSTKTCTRTNSHKSTATSVNLSMKWTVAILHDLVLHPVQ